LGSGNDDRQIGKQNLEQLVKTKIMRAGKSTSPDPCWSNAIKITDGKSFNLRLANKIQSENHKSSNLRTSNYF
jgi:hypothetical protein